MSVLKVQMVKIPVSDVTVAVPFYRDVIGMSEEFTVAEYGWAQLSAGNLPVALYEQGKGGGQGQPGTCDSLHLATDDLTPVIDRLKVTGVDTSQMPAMGDDGTAHIDVADPDGNRIKIVQVTD